LVPDERRIRAVSGEPDNPAASSAGFRRVQTASSLIANLDASPVVNTYARDEQPGKR
jgi:hypothetical protein